MSRNEDIKLLKITQSDVLSLPKHPQGTLSVSAFRSLALYPLSEKYLQEAYRSMAADQ